MARIHAIMRRQTGRVQPVLQSGAITLDPAQHQVCVGDSSLNLSAKEFALLETLMMEPGKVISKQQLEETLYGWDEEIGSNAIEVHIHHLRKKLPANSILTVRGVGYRVNADD